MPDLPAVGVDGPKGVGKTATGLQRAATVLSLDDPVALSVVSADPVRALGRPRPILIDEWQRAPEVWDHVRRAVDDGAPASSFLLTGSATPALGSTTHSGAPERGEHEVDLIVERHDGNVLGIEVKLAASIDDKDVRHLHWLREHHGPRVRDLIVLTTGPHAYRRPDGVAVVPLGLLGP